MAFRFSRRFLLLATLWPAAGYSTCVFTQSAWSQAVEESFEERLRRAVEHQNQQNEADEVERKRLSSSFAARRAATQEQDRHELRQMVIDFREKHRSLKEEGVRRERELSASLKDDEAKLADALADLKAEMTIRGAYSEWKFDRGREAFSRKLQSDVAEQLAKAEAERERQKQIAIAAVMAYFTGGTSLAAMGPALASAGGGKPTLQPSNASPGTAASPVTAIPTRMTKVAGGPLVGGDAGSVKIPTRTKPDGFPAKASTRVRVYDSPAGLPVRPVIEEEGVYPDWIDPIGFLFAEGVNAARGLGGLIRGGSKAAPTARPTPTRIYSARELVRSAEDVGAYHNFPAQLDNYVLEGARRVVSDKYVLYTRPGTLNGRAGTFEMGVQPSPSGGVEVVKHRFFNPEGPPPLP